jgi:hypothetical protein
MSGEYRLLQDGLVVAASTSAPDILHYALVYGGDGPVKMQQRINGRWVDVAEGDTK